MTTLVRSRQRLSSGAATTYGYNTRGDRTSAGATTYAYDQANRLTNYNSGAGTYAYDGDGFAKSKTVGGTTKQFLYDIAEGLSQVLVTEPTPTSMDQTESPLNKSPDQP